MYLVVMFEVLANTELCIVCRSALVCCSCCIQVVDGCFSLAGSLYSEAVLCYDLFVSITIVLSAGITV